MQYYIRNHMLGGFLNDAHSTSLVNNCAYVTVDCGYQVPPPPTRMIAMLPERRCA